MQVIGLVGGVASGKSVVARLLEELGAQVLDADRIGHEVLESDCVRAAIRRRWGENVFSADATVDRRRIAKIVFGDAPGAAGELEFLEQITHPRIRERLAGEIARLAAGGTDAAAVDAVVLDAPVMLKAGWDRLCDRVVFVDAPPEVRLARAKARGWSEEEFAAREVAQDSLDTKRARADVMIDNSGPLADTRAAVRRFWQTHID